MGNSPLVDYTELSPSRNHPRRHSIDTITVHHMAGNLSVESCGKVFQNRPASSNYGIDSQGRVGLYVDEGDRSWASANPANDHRAVTIEVANCGGAPDWPVSAAAYAKLVELAADICRRNGIEKLVWSDYRTDRIGHKEGCNMTVHRDFMATSCPGPYLMGKMPQLAADVNAALGAATPPAGPGTDTAPTPTLLQVGDVVDFRGTRHYVSSDAVKGSACRPGLAKVTAVARGAKHPYHLVGVTGGTVYGWVDAGDAVRSGSAA